MRLSKLAALVSLIDLRKSRRSVVMATTDVDVWLDSTWEELHAQLGGVPLSRIRSYPPPGSATEKDVLETERRTGRLCELVDGMLVEKAMGYYESVLAGVLIHLLHDYLETHPVGFVGGEAGTLRILPDQVRIPDVSFVSWERYPQGLSSKVPIPAAAPDLAVEVLSSGNTPAEMRRKLRDYFTAGTRLVWYIDPATRSATMYTAPDQCVYVAQHESLDGGEVLPGFRVTLAELFARADQRPTS
jgi:Uma2 family endonuclease